MTISQGQYISVQKDKAVELKDILAMIFFVSGSTLLLSVINEIDASPLCLITLL